MKSEIKVAIEVAFAAGKMIKHNLGKHKRLRYKGKINIVTDIDEKAEELIIKRLKRTFPDDSILAEERPEEKKGQNKWIIDPLDGTTNFAHRFPFFAVSIALEKDREIVLGVVYDPMHEELFTAEKGKGAYLNKKRILVSKEKNIAKAFLATGFAYGFKEKRRNNNIDNFIKFLRVCLALRRAGAASLDLCYVACGRFDGFWEMDLSPWDTAAASLIVNEAQGKVSQFNESKFSHYKPNILASNGLIHKKMAGILSKSKK